MHSRNFCKSNLCRRSSSIILELSHSLASQPLGCDFIAGRILDISPGLGQLIPIAQDTVLSLPLGTLFLLLRKVISVSPLVVHVFLRLVASPLLLTHNFCSVSPCSLRASLCVSFHFWPCYLWTESVLTSSDSWEREYTHLFTCPIWI